MKSNTDAIGLPRRQRSVQSLVGELEYRREDLWTA